MSARRPVLGTRSRPGVRRVVALVVAVTLVLVAVSGLALFTTEQDLRRVQDRQQAEIVPARLGVATLLALFVDEETAERGFVLTGDERFLEPYNRASRQIEPLLAQIETQTARVDGMDVRVTAVRSAHNAWLRLAVRPEIDAVQAGRQDYAERLVAEGAGRVLFDELRRAHSAADARLAAYDADATAEASQLSRRLTFLLAGTLVLLTALAALTAFTLEVSVLRPLQRIGRRVRSVSAGDLDTVVEGDGPREFRELASDVDTMRRRLLDEIGSARHATEALALREPTVVALQAALAPTLSSSPGVEIAARLEPAEGVLAGDFVDTVLLGGGRLGIVLGDVAGHGPAPAIFGLRLKLLLGSLLSAGLEPGEVLRAALERLDDVTEETFATVVVAVVDPAAETVAYANGGHPAPLLLTTGAVPHELSSTGPFLSPLFREARWETRTAAFTRRYLLLAYTDGVIEARDSAGHEIGLERTIATLRTRRPDEPLDSLLDVVYGEIRDHAVELKDDTTLLLCRHSALVLPSDEDEEEAAADR